MNSGKCRFCGEKWYGNSSTHSAREHETVCKLNPVNSTNKLIVAKQGIAAKESSGLSISIPCDWLTKEIGKNL